MKRLLVVTAHPDDEVGSFGGTLLKYRALGAETYVISLTAGEAATNRGRATSDAELAELRRAEFAASCNVLKIFRAWVLDYKDGALDREAFYRVTGDLVKRIRELRPHVVLTFAGEGSSTGHPDHTMTSLFTTAAFHWAGRTNRYADQLWMDLRPHQAQKLYYKTQSFLVPDRPHVAPPGITCEIDVAEHFEAKLRAFRQHSSQEPLFEAFEEHLRKKPSLELFHLAAALIPQKVPLETDLFEGVTD